MLAGFTFFGAGVGAVVTGYKSCAAVLRSYLITYISVAVDALLNQFVTVFDFGFGIGGAGIAAGAVIVVIGTTFGGIRFGSGGTGIGIIGIFKFAGAGNILAANRIFVVALSAGAESGQFAFREAVGTDTGGKEQGISRTIRIRRGNFIAFAVSEGVGGAVGRLGKVKVIVLPMGQKMGFGKLYRL